MSADKKDQMTLFVEDGLAAGSVAAIFSGVPSTLFIMLTSQQQSEYLPKFEASLLAVGNVLLPASLPKIYLLVAAIVIHLFLSYTFALFLAYVCRRKNIGDYLTYKRCILLGIFAHIVNLVILPAVINAPLLTQLLETTTHVPHFLDHMAYAVTVAAVIQDRKATRRVDDSL